MFALHAETLRNILNVLQAPWTEAVGVPALPYGPFNGRILERVRVTEADSAGE